MTKQSFLFVVALVLLLAVIAVIVLWIAVSSAPAITFEEAKAEYLSYFPESLRNATLLTCINILALAVAGALFYRVAAVPSYRLASIILGILCALLLMWQAFSLL